MPLLSNATDSEISLVLSHLFALAKAESVRLGGSWSIGATASNPPLSMYTEYTHESGDSIACLSRDRDDRSGVYTSHRFIFMKGIESTNPKGTP